MTLQYFVRRLKKIYNVKEIYYAPRDVIELWFHIENAEVVLAYSGETVRESTYKDMLRRIEDDLKYEEVNNASRSRD